MDWLPGTGALLATGSEANEARVWAAAGGGPPRLLATLPHEAEVLRVAWRNGGSGSEGAPQAATLATATATGTVRLFQVGPPPEEEGDGAAPSAREVSTVAEWAHPQQTQVYALKWLEEDAQEGAGGGSELLTAADDKVYFWDVEQR